MRSLILVFSLVLALHIDFAVADPLATTARNPLARLQMRIDHLAAQLDELEKSLPNPNVEGRMYCMLVNVIVLQGLASNGSEQVATQVVRRLTEFSGGMFASTLISSSRNLQDDNGLVSMVPGTSPGILSGTYTQTNGQLDLTFSDGATATWYVSGDGTTIHSNGIGILGPFPPNSLTIGLARDATLIESDSCESFTP